MLALAFAWLKTHFQAFFIVFDTANASASMPLLVKIHNMYRSKLLNLPLPLHAGPTNYLVHFRFAFQLQLLSEQSLELSSIFLKRYGIFQGTASNAKFNVLSDFLK